MQNDVNFEYVKLYCYMFFAGAACDKKWRTQINLCRCGTSKST